jgi:hypothetical protein
MKLQAVLLGTPSGLAACASKQQTDAYSFDLFWWTGIVSGWYFDNNLNLHPVSYHILVTNINLIR